MIRSIRGRLQWWYGAVYALSIIAFGCLVYWRADRDVHERATLQAVSTAQYLDVSLRNVRPDAIRDRHPWDLSGGDDEQRNGGPPGEFALGPLPPEFQFRPPPPRRPAFDNQAARRSGEPDRPGPPRGSGPGRGPNGPGSDGPRPGPNGPGRRGLAGPDGRQGEPLESVRPPESDPYDDGPQPPVDRMEFAVWRPDGSVLTQSAGFPSDRLQMAAGSQNIGPAPQVNMVEGKVEVAKHGPHGARILVIRPMENDMDNLHRFGFQIAAMALGTLLVGLTGGWWISGRMVQPIRMISETAAQISATSLNRRIKTDHLDQELVQLGSVLNGTFGRLEESFGRLTQFTADASHELRTPLAVIQSQAELALSQPRSTDSYQQTLEICLKSSDRMRSLIDGLLLLARTDSDRVELRRTPVDLRVVAEDAVAQLQDKAITAGIEIECATPESPLLVLGDSRFLMQVPANLIDNAIQHSAPGGKIFVEVRTDGADALLSVRDAGCGIAAEHIPHLFERFYRVDVGRSRKHGGSGLGLSICKSLVEAHGGSIHCDSTPGEGSVFTVRLPLSEVAAGLENTRG